MRVLGLIPARGGSVRIPRKNLAEVGGRPLLAWTLKGARDSDMIDEIVVSTEDAEIAEIAKTLKCRVINRPNELAHDDTPMLPVVHHALKECPADIVVLLQPTSPFRAVTDIRSALNIFCSRQADAVVSVTQAPDDMVFEVGHAGRMRLADNIVVPNGAVYIISADALARGHDWYSGVTYAYHMSRDRSLDIDTPNDLIMARAIAEQHAAA